jgi:hypothetical protein
LSANCEFYSTEVLEVTLVLIRNNNMKKVIFGALLGLLALDASATCRRSDAAGNWYAAISGFGNKVGFIVGKCELSVDRKGLLTSGYCSYSNGTKVPVSGGLVVDANCKAAWTIVQGGMGTIIETGMSRGKDSTVGVYETEIGPIGTFTSGTFSAVKK